MPQTHSGEPTDALVDTHPMLFAYLSGHAEAFRSRRSRVYRGKPQFAVFGVGPYSFLPWKVAIPALYKRLDFHLVAPVDGKPVLFDDTVYFVSFATRKEAEKALSLMSSVRSDAAYRSMIFWDEMRPIKTSILNAVDWSADPQ